MTGHRGSASRRNIRGPAAIRVFVTSVACKRCDTSRDFQTDPNGDKPEGDAAPSGTGRPREERGARGSGRSGHPRGPGAPSAT